MGQFQGALTCAALATLFWGGLGLSLASWLPLPRSLKLPLAPTLGWAVHSIAALSIFLLTGMTGPSVTIAAGLSVVGATVAFWKRPRCADAESGPAVPVWAIVTAGVVAVAIMLAIIPKVSDQGVALAFPVFDHAKIAIIDDIARLGVPAGNPFIGEAGGFDRLFYYYLWHFSAAELVVLTGLTGWDADAGMTGFTALCSLLLMTGFAVRIGGQTISAGWALILAVAGSIRPIVTLLLGWDTTAEVIGEPSGFGAWIFQIAWAPQHVASANCICVAIFLIVQLARHRTYVLAIALGAVAAAAFASSTWVGGVTFPLAAVAVVTLLVLRPLPHPGSFVMLLTVSGMLAVALATPLLIEQLKGATSRGDGFPIALAPFNMLGDTFSPTAQLLLKIPVYWTFYLFVELAAIYPAGLLMAARLARDHGLTSDRRRLVTVLGMLAVVGLIVGCLLKSTTASNNDLAWRGVLPSLMGLVALTAAGLSRYFWTTRPIFLGVLLLSISLAFADGLRNIYNNAVVAASPSSQRFADSAAMWSAVRKYAEPTDRVVNNPNYLSDMTRWPINISWALLADRRSCYAGSDLVLPFAPLTKQQREEADALFTRVFVGRPQDGDVALMRNHYNCDVVVLTPDDGGWNKDQLTSSGIYRLVEADPAWRIYRRADRR